MCGGFFFFFKQKTAYEIRPCDWSSDVCSSDLGAASGDSPSAKPSRIPSVAKKRVSPGAMASTTGWRRGSSDPTMPPRVTRLARAAPDRAAPSPYTSRPSTLPTPTHVRDGSCRLNAATLITAPRVPFRARWQRSSSGAGDSVACRSSAATAALAALAASVPWPSPSTTATSTPVPTGLTRCRSPDSASPGRAREATPHSINAGAPTEASGIHAAPFFHRHRGSLPDGRAHVEIVHQASRPREPQAQASGRRVAVLEGALDVPDPRALIAGDDHHALAVTVADHAERDFAPFGVHEDVARDLGNRGGDHRLVSAREARLRCQIAPALPGRDDVRVGGDRNQEVVSHGRCGAAPGGRGTAGLPRDPARWTHP